MASGQNEELLLGFGELHMYS